MHTAVTKGGLCDECAELVRETGEPLIRVARVAPAPAPGARLRSPVGLSYALVALFCVWAVSDAVAFAGQRLGSDVLFELGDGVEAVVLIALMFTFLTWFYRVRDNAEVFAPGSQTWGRRWAFWGWVVPVANFWVPRRIAVDAWLASTQRLPDGSAPPPPTYRIINLWWGCWLLSMVTDYFPGHVDDVPLLSLGLVVNAGSAATAALFVRRLTGRQDVLARTGPVAAAV
jgi:hypothetical protein